MYVLGGSPRAKSEKVGPAVQKVERGSAEGRMVVSTSRGRCGDCYVAMERRGEDYNRVLMRHRHDNCNRDTDRDTNAGGVGGGGDEGVGG